jgi:hypothetical protein
MAMPVVRNRRSLGIAAVAVLLTIGLAGSGAAQDATPVADEPAGFPNHFHVGTCAELDPAPAVPLADLQFPDWVPAMTGEDDGSIEVALPEPADFGNAPIPVAFASTEVAVPLADILAGGHALNVHNPENLDDYVACGNIGGVPDERGDLFVGLDEVDDSGYSGIAWLHDNGAGTTVVVFLSDPSAQGAIDAGLAAMAAEAAVAAEEEAAATPAATPEITPEAEATPVA